MKMFNILKNKKIKAVSFLLIFASQNIISFAEIPFDKLQEAPFKNVDEEMKNLPVSIAPYFTIVDDHHICSLNKDLTNNKIEIKNKAYTVKLTDNYSYALNLYECDNVIGDNPIFRKPNSSINALLDQNLYFFYQDEEDQYHFASILLEQGKLDQYFTNPNFKAYLLNAAVLKPKKTSSKSLIYVKNDKGDYQIAGFMIIGIDDNINDKIPSLGIALLPTNSKYDKTVLAAALKSEPNPTSVIDVPLISALTKTEINKETSLPLLNLNGTPNKPILPIDSNTIYAFNIVGEAEINPLKKDLFTVKEIKDNLIFLKDPILTQPPIERADINSHSYLKDKQLFISINLNDEPCLFSFFDKDVRTEKKGKDIAIIIKITEAQIKAITQNPFVYVKSEEGKYYLVGTIKKIATRNLLNGDASYNYIVIDSINNEVNNKINRSILQEALKS